MIFEASAFDHSNEIWCFFSSFHSVDNDVNDERPTQSSNNTEIPSQIAPQSGETHYSSSQSGKEVSDIFATATSQQIVSLAEVRMSEFIEGQAQQNAEVLDVNPLETEQYPANPGRYNMFSAFLQFKTKAT